MCPFCVRALLSISTAACPRIVSPIKMGAVARLGSPWEDASFDLGDRVRVEGDDLGAGCAQLFDVVGGDGADRAEVLGQDQVGLQRLEQRAVNRVQGASVTDRLAYGSVDFQAGQARRFDTRSGHDGEAVNLGWPVALLRNADE